MKHIIQKPETRTVMVDVITMPSQVYNYPRSKENIRITLQEANMMIVDFRVVRPGDRFISAANGTCIMQALGGEQHWGPRFIVAPNPPAPKVIGVDEAWE